MYTKKQIFTRAAAEGSKAETLRGAIRALRGARVKVMPCYGQIWDLCQRRKVSPMPEWRRMRDPHASYTGHTPPSDAIFYRSHWGGEPYRLLRVEYRTPREMHYADEHLRRYDRRMNRLAYETMERFGLLDREQMGALIAATSETIAHHEAARMRRMQPARRAAHLARLLAAPAEADQLLHAIYDPLALELATSYHAHVEHIYQSARASIHFGAAAQQKDWAAYSKRYGHPAVWVDAGVSVRLDPERGPLAVIQTNRDKVFSLPIHRDVAYAHPALLDGDLYATERHGIIQRYDIRDRKTGIAMRIPEMGGMPAAYWEHGKDVEECRAEYARKLQIRRDKVVSLLHDTDYRARRKARLVARLCRGLVCTVDDARSVGFCRAGIDAFRRRHGLDEHATVDQLRATRDGQVTRVIEAAAVRCVRTANV